MDSVKLFLGKFQDLRPVDDELKDLLRKIIKDVTGATLKKQVITIQKWTVYLKAPAALRSEIYLHQEKIMAKLEAALGRKGIKKVI